MSLFVGSMLAIATAGATELSDKIAANNCHARGKRVFTPLPAGAVKPRGWLRDRARAAAAGNLGNMDRCGEKFREAWAPDFRMTGEDLYWRNRRGWPYEGGGYWFDGLVRLAFELDDPLLIAKAQGKLDGVVTNMTAKGLGFLWWLKRDDPELDQIPSMETKWVIGPYGMLGRAVAAYQEARPTPRYRAALADAFNFNPKILDCGWAAIAPQAAVLARELTGDKAIDAALDGYYAKVRSGKIPTKMKTVPTEWRGLVREQTAGHGVTFCEDLTGMVFGYYQTGDRAFLENAMGWVRKMEEIGLNPNGAFSADEHFRPAGAYVGTEVCTIAAHQWLLVNLLSADGDGSWGDRIESLFFNAGEAAFTRNFTSNLVIVYPNRPRLTTYYGGNYTAFAGCGCCTANSARILPIFVQHLWMATADGGLAAVVYAPSEVSTVVAGGVSVKIETETAYPYGETIDLRVTPARAANFPLRLRLPAWCDCPELTVNGSPVSYATERGFALLDRTWKAGDRVSLKFPMKPQVVCAVDRTNPKEHFGVGSKYTTQTWLADQDESLAAENAAVRMGPLCFALGIPELDATGNAPDKSAPWQYVLDPATVDAKVERRPMPTVWDAPFDAPLKVSVAARKASWAHDEKAPRLPKPGEITCGESCRLELVPYNGTTFRISQFPVVRH